MENNCHLRAPRESCSPGRLKAVRGFPSSAKTGLFLFCLEYSDNLSSFVNRERHFWASLQGDGGALRGAIGTLNCASPETLGLERLVHFTASAFIGSSQNSLDSLSEGSPGDTLCQSFTNMRWPTLLTERQGEKGQRPYLQANRSPRKGGWDDILSGFD